MPLSFGQTIAASDASADAYFGCCIDISGDYAAIGAEGDNGDRGAVYIFKLISGVWTEMQKIVAGDAAPNDFFGLSVALDGDTVVIGAPWDDDDGSKSGSVYIWRRSGETWSLEQKITASDAAAGDEFGNSVAISGDSLIAGASGEGSSGAAYVFIRSGVTWSEQQKLTVAYGSADSFGWGVSIDGDTAAVIDPYDDALVSYNGAAYIFDRSGAVWSETARLVGSQGATKDYLGERGGESSCFRLLNDVLVVGAPGPSTTPGRVYVFSKNGGPWSEAAILTATAPLGDMQGQFGGAVDYDGTRIIVGDPYVQNAGPVYLGGIYIYELDGGVWTQVYSYIGPEDPGWPWAFGDSVRISAQQVLVGSRNVDDPPNSDEGRAYGLSITSGTVLSEPVKLPAAGLYIDEIRGVKLT
jgi:hypothetical protein